MTLSARAIEGERRRFQNKLARRRERRTEAFTPPFKAALRRMADAGGRLCLIGNKLATPDNPASPCVQLRTARELYRSGMVRFITHVDSTLVELTAKGVRTAETLRQAEARAREARQ